MGETGQRWTAAGVILVLLGGVYAYGKTQGELDLMVEWSKEADTRLKDVESSTAANTKGLESLQQIMQKIFVTQLRPESDAYPHSPWSGKPTISP